MTGFDVATQALHTAATDYEHAADQWDQLAKDMSGWSLGENDLGVIGKQANVINDYNGAVQTIYGKVQQSATNMRTAANDLSDTAGAYTAVNDNASDELNKAAHAQS